MVVNPATCAVVGVGVDVAVRGLNVDTVLVDVSVGGILLGTKADSLPLLLPTVPPTAPPTTAPIINIPTMRRMNFPPVMRRGGAPFAGFLSAESPFLVRPLVSAFAASTSAFAAGVSIAGFLLRPLSDR